MKQRAVMLLIIFLSLGALTAQTANIHGFVRDSDGKEPLFMVNVTIKNSTQGTTTNEKGFYSIAGLHPGKYTLVFSYIGYTKETKVITLSPGEEKRLDVLLLVEPLMGETIVTEASREKNNLEIQPGRLSIPVVQLKEMPQLAEPDLFRSLQMLPGVATLSDFSAGLYIRGGSPDQNMILLDNIDVYNPNHMFGFFSTFNSDALKNVELLKGGFPAKYGGRLSSVMVVLNDEGNRDHVEGTARAGLLGSGLTIEGPWKKGSWMFSGRRTYLDLAAKLIGTEIPYYFYDTHGKINYDMNSNNQLGVSFYFGNDNLDLSSGGTDITLNWGNKTFSSQWMHLFNSKLYSNFMVAGSRYKSDTKIKLDDVSFGIFNQIEDLTSKAILTWSPSSRHTFDFGTEAKLLWFRLNYDIVGNTYKNEFKGTYLSSYLQDNIHLGTKNIIQPGIRVGYYSDGNYLRYSPRIAFKRILSPYINLTASFGKYYQFLNMVHQDGMSFADMWFPVDDSFSPGEADHYIVGITYDNNYTWSLNIEGYYKKYHHLAEYRVYRGADEPLDNQDAAQNFLDGNGNAYGIDLIFRNNYRRWNGWIGYSLAWTKKKVNNYNFGLEYYPTYDRRHTFMANQNIFLNQRWKLNVTFKYGSGQPFTQPTAKYAVLNPDGSVYYQPLDGRKNFYRLPDYQRLDLGITYLTTLYGKDLNLYLQIINLLNHKNVWFRDYDTTDNPTTIDDQHMLPLIPTFGVSYKF